jgi:hypothetical protein
LLDPKLIAAVAERLMAPVVLVVPDCVIVFPVAVIDVSGVAFPTAAPKLITPAVPAVSVRGAAPFTVVVAPEKLMFAPAGETPALVVSKVGVPDKTTPPEKVRVFALVVMLPPTLLTPT